MIGFIIKCIRENPVAWYGAIVATISVILNVLKYLKDRPQIRIKFQKDMKIFDSPLYNRNKTYLVITVINTGRRPIKITNAGTRVYMGEKKFMVFSDSFTIPGERILTEASPSTVFCVDQNLVDLENIEYFFAEDAIGRIYKKFLSPPPYRIYKKLKFSLSKKRK